MCIPTPRSITVEEVKRHVHYDPDTGHFTRLIRTGRRHHVGDRADYLAGRYRGVTIMGERFLAHRLAVFYMTGKWPEYVVDHLDRDCQNNAWENLAPCTQSQNLQNQGVRAKNSTGTKNLYKTRSGKYRAQKMVNGELRASPYCDTPEEALSHIGATT